MTLTPLQVADVQRTWELCVPIADAAADIFYQRLFELDPSLRELFPADMKEQKKKLMTMITTAVRTLKNLDALVPAVQALGIRHRDYRVQDRHYGTVGAALLFTLEQGLGAAWTPTVKDAWVAVYGLLSSVMMAAGRSGQGRGAPP